MAQLPLYLLTGVDVRRDSNPDLLRGITLASITIPTLTFTTGEHNPGGGVMGVNFVLPRIEAAEPAFSAKGIDTDIFSGFGEVDRWTFAGSYLQRGPGGGKPVPGRSIIEGAINSWEPDESAPAEFQGCTHSFSEVTHYEFWLNGVELFYVDFWERVLRVNGVDKFAAHRQALGG